MKVSLSGIHDVEVDSCEGPAVKVDNSGRLDVKVDSDEGPEWR